MPNCIIGERKEAFEKFEHLIYHQLSHNKYQQLVEANELYLCITKFENYFYNHAEQQKIEDMIWALLNKRIIIINGFIIDTPQILTTKMRLFLLLFIQWNCCFRRGRIAIAGIQKNTQKLFIFPVEKTLLYTLSNQQFNRKK